MSKLTSRERVRKALNHEQPDLVPIDFGAMRSTGISAIAYNNLKDYLEINDGETKMYDVFQQLAEPEESVLKKMGGDVVQLHRLAPAFGVKLGGWKPWQLRDGSPCLVPDDFNPHKNEQGELEIRDGDRVIAKMPEDGLYFDIVHHPLSEAWTREDIDRLNFPEITAEELEWLATEAKRLYNKTEYAILGEFGGNIFESGQMDWGYERYYLELGLKSDILKYYHQRLMEADLKNLKKYLETVGDYIDIIQFGDDLGTQQGPQVSEDMYRELIMPYHQQQFQFVRENYPGVKVFLHSCGSVYDLIPDLIEAGVEILNPVQLSARKMDPEKLKDNFGDELVFWGGGCDTQTTLNNGTVEDVKQEVARQIEILAPGGGFVFTQVHNIQANVAPEKIVALYETARSNREYPI
ncbi:MAG: uroporphyrinogen decarboxylase family protein [Bacillota bacterium]